MAKLKRLSGLNPLAYQGVEASSPPQQISSTENPTTADYRGFNLGDEWINTSSNQVWKYMGNTSAGVANWIEMAAAAGVGASNFATDSGTAVDLLGTINVLGGSNINTDGTVANTVTINLDNSPSVSGSVTGGTGLIATTGGVTATAGDITATTGDIIADAGNITATLGSLSAGTTVTAGTGINATTGNITADAGDLIATLGAVNAATTVTAGTGLIATTGGVTATAGDIVATAGNIEATIGNIEAIAGSISAAVDLVSQTGNIEIASTAMAGTAGIIVQNSSNFIHSYGAATTTNIFAGRGAGNLTLTPASANHASGFGALSLTALTTGAANTGLGYSAGTGITTGGNNTFVGSDAGKTIATTSDNTAVGFSALKNSSSSTQCVAVGSGALTTSSTKADCTAIGYNAMTLATTADQSVAVGSQALASVTTGDENIAIGYQSMQNATGSKAIAIGNKALDANQEATTGNIAIGHNAALAVTTSDSVIAIGNDALKTLTSATQGCIAIGYKALEFNTGNGNIGIGRQTLQASATFGANVVIGDQAGTAVGGSQNVLIGSGVGGSTLTQSGNVGIGYSALSANDASNCIAIGTLACRGVAASTSDCISIGEQSLVSITTGSTNIVIGHNGGDSLTTGANNILIGDSVGSALTSSESSNILIGNAGVITESNVIRLGTTGAGAGQQGKCWIAGIRGVTTDVADAVAVLIDSTGQLGTVSSSARYKENVSDMRSASQALMSLRPVVFNYKSDEKKTPQYGLIAEEVAEEFKDLVVFDEQGDPETVKYHVLPALLLNELQILARKVEELESRCSCRH